jgi:hypothetical protein
MSVCVRSFPLFNEDQLGAERVGEMHRSPAGHNFSFEVVVCGWDTEIDGFAFELLGFPVGQ